MHACVCAGDRREGTEALGQGAGETLPHGQRT